MGFVSVCATTDLVHGKPYPAVVDGVEIVLVDVEGEVFALLDECSHGSVKLSEGEVSECKLECWLHGSRFDLRTGQPDCPPATEPVPTYPVTIEGDTVFVDIENPINA